MKKFPVAAVVTAVVLSLLLLAATSAPETELEVGAHEHHSMESMEHGNMLAELAADGDPAPGIALPRNGWTASASDQESARENTPAGNVLDGNPGSIWHSRWSGTAAPLPHSITIDMKSTQALSGLSYLPRQDNNRNGNIGQYSVSVSADGTNWGAPVVTGTWIDDPTQKTVTFSANGRYLRLTAQTEAGNRGPFTAAAEIYALGAQTAATALPRAGWTVAASDQETVGENAPASNVLDGNPGTIWHSRWSSAPAPLPHTLTVDMKASRNVEGITYLPRQTGGSNGNISQYSVSVSNDGTNFGNPVATGVWDDNQSQKRALFASTLARYVRLTAIGEAGNTGPWTSMAELNVLGTGGATNPPPTSTSLGKWDAPINFPIVPVSAVVLPNNKLLTFSAYDARNYDKSSTNTRVSILDLNTGQVSLPENIDRNHQMFCTGLTLMADGRVLINGGSTDGATTFYDPVSNTWTRGPLMNIPRAYQGNTLLSTGQTFTLGGSWNDSAGGKDGEIFTPNGNGGTWQRLSGITANPILTADPGGVFRSDNHAWLFATSNGGVFHAGPSKQMNWITTAGNGTIRSAGNRGTSADAMNGNAVMYDVGKILTVGGSPAYQDSNATNRAYVIDISRGPTQPVITTRTADMAFPRAFNNSVVLPDGKVIVMGGQQYAVPFTDNGAARSPEIWDPATGRFTVLAPENSPRTYHSVAALLPDGRVFSGGGGLCGNCATNHLDGQIFTPPYLLDGNGNPKARPMITNAPTTANAGSTITVSTSSPISSWALVRTTAVTHSLNTDQRRIPVTASSTNGTSYTLPIPADKGVALPGVYMLFAMDANGTPSISKFIRIP